MKVSLPPSWRAVKHSLVTILLDAIAAPLALLPVARVLAALRGLQGALKDPKSMSQALLEVALVHLVGAVPGEVTNGWSCLPEHSPGEMISP